MFRALVVDRVDKQSRTELAELADDRLPAGEVTIRVEWSTLNYKDALAITGRSPVVRSFPMVPGIDLAGTVESSDGSAWKAGQAVLANGWGLGEAHWGGLAQRARLPAAWLQAIPPPFGAREAMAVGTAGYTAMLCVLALERHGVRPGDGDVLVTGAAGGVGSVAIPLLAARGHRVVASTGRVDEASYLRSLGASDVIPRAELAGPVKPLARERWAGVVDAVGSTTLANACAATRYGGAVAACGLAGGMDFPATVAPFILRGVTLYGIDSVQAPMARREEAWRRLASDLDLGKLRAMTREIALGDAPSACEELLAGKVRGRIAVDVNR